MSHKSTGETLSFAKREYIKLLIRIVYAEAKEPRSEAIIYHAEMPYDRLAFSSVRWALESHREVKITLDDVKVIAGMYDYLTLPTLNNLKDEVLLYIYSKLSKIEERLK
jgi:hypothetical protein